MTPLQVLIKTLRHRRTIASFAEQLGTTRQTVMRWEAGTQIRRSENIGSLARYIGKPSGEVEAYLAGEMTLDALLQGTKFEKRLRGKSPVAFDLVLEALRFFSTHQLGMLMSRVGQLLMDRSLAHTIQDLIDRELERSPWAEADDPMAAFAERVDLRVEEIESILDGDRPTPDQIVALSSQLKKDDGSNWKAEELHALTKQQYHAPNGVGS